MIFNYIIAILLILALLAGWIGVQFLSRRFASRHPEWGAPREEGSGCGFFCLCKNGAHCPRAALKRPPSADSK